MFEGKVVIVTGSGSGIGRVTAKAFAANGAAVAVNDIEEEAAQSTVKEIEASGGRAISCVRDVSDWKSVERMANETVAKFGRIDVLVNNARIAKGLVSAKVSFLEYPIEQWDKEIAVGLKGVMLCCKAVLPTMFKQGSGCIINIAASLGITGAKVGGLAVYAATKAGVIVFTKSLARDVAQHGVRVCCIAPGTIDTPGRVQPLTSEGFKNLLAEVTLARVGHPEEVANAILFLASDKASYITGSLLAVDGGRSSH